MTTHYAFIDDNNVVTEVIVGVDENELIEGIPATEWYSKFKGQRCVTTSYDHEFRGIYAGIGYSYNEEEDIFVTPQPSLTWTRNGSHWEPPVPKPEGRYVWVDEIQNWISTEQ